MAEKEKIILKPKPSKMPRFTSINDDFVEPNPPRTRKQSKSQQQQHPVSFLSPNGFEQLSNIEVDDSDDNISLPSTSTSPPLRRKNPDQGSKKQAKPIIVTKTTFSTLKTTLSVLKLSQQATIQKRKGNDFAIFAANSVDKKKIIEKFKEIDQQHFTYSEPQDRHLIFALLGYFETPTLDLLKDLQSENIPAVAVIKVNKSLEDPIFLVTFKKQAITLSDLQYRFNVINGLRVKWDKHRPRNRRPAQCHRCQRFGHAAINCSLTFRCVKCTDTHEPGACARKSRDEGLPSCVNCNIEGHASNSPRCPAYLKYVETIKARKKPPTQRQSREFPASSFNWNEHRVDQHFPTAASQPAPSTSNPTYVNREYRPFLSQPKNPSPPVNNDSFSQLFKLQNDLSSIPDIQETIRLFATLVEELKTANSQSERIAVLFKHLGSSSQILLPQK